MHSIQDKTLVEPGSVDHKDLAALAYLCSMVFSLLFSSGGYRMGVHQYRVSLLFDYLSKIKARSVDAFACAIIDAAACDSTL
jgi:hypothetical protein